MQRAADGVGGFKAVRRSDEDEVAHIDHCRSLQRTLFDGGFAGICVPRAYGGQGLTAAHQAAFNREIRGYEYPADTQVPTLHPVHVGDPGVRDGGAEGASRPAHPAG